MIEPNEHLIALFEENQIREKKKLDIIRNPERKFGQILSLKGINEIFFLKKAFIDGDFQESKEYLYKIGLLNSFYFEFVKGDIFQVLNSFTFPVLSDSSELIKLYLKYDPIEYHDSFSAYFAKSIQAIILDDLEKLRICVKGLEKHSKKGWEKNFVGITIACNGFLHDNEDEIERGIHEILALHTVQDHVSITKEFINFEATTLAKLAFRKGGRIKIESPIIPKELLSIKELSHYKNYDFLDEFVGQL